MKLSLLLICLISVSFADTMDRLIDSLVESEVGKGKKPLLERLAMLMTKDKSANRESTKEMMANYGVLINNVNEKLDTNKDNKFSADEIRQYFQDYDQDGNEVEDTKSIKKALRNLRKLMKKQKLPGVVPVVEPVTVTPEVGGPVVPLAPGVTLPGGKIPLPEEELAFNKGSRASNCVSGCLKYDGWRATACLPEFLTPNHWECTGAEVNQAVSCATMCAAEWPSLRVQVGPKESTAGSCVPGKLAGIFVSFWTKNCKPKDKTACEKKNQCKWVSAGETEVEDNDIYTCRTPNKWPEADCNEMNCNLSVYQRVCAKTCCEQSETEVGDTVLKNKWGNYDCNAATDCGSKTYQRMCAKTCGKQNETEVGDTVLKNIWGNADCNATTDCDRFAYQRMCAKTCGERND